ncbi:MAG TPA: DUF2490 domain-containing protein [Chitinophaga sp.]
MRRIILVMLFVSLQYVSSAQEKTPVAAWLFPGLSWRPEKNVRLLGQLGYNDYFRMGIFYPQAFVTIHKNIILNPAYIYAVQKREYASTVQEHYLMNAVIFQVSSKGFLLDSRNMLWNRLTVGSAARHYYRNRARAMQSFKTWSATTRLYVYEEIFWLFNQGNLSRNRAALGITSDLTRHITIDVTYIRQWDQTSGPLNLFFVAGIWQL